MSAGLPQVRRYAVAVMSRAGDEELALYLLQLVQALRFERRDDSHLAAFLVHRALQCPVLTNFLHWYLVVRNGPRLAQSFFRLFVLSLPSWSLSA